MKQFFKYVLALSTTFSIAAKSQEHLFGALTAGVSYTPEVSLTFRAELDAQMIAYPDGIPSTTGTIFTTAMNRSDQSLEIVGVYEPNEAAGGLGIFDWSCRPESPCGDKTGPSWIYFKALNDAPCFVEPFEHNGKYLPTVHYRNSTEAPLATQPDHWTNSAFVWNHCSGDWELIYSHDYVHKAADCSLTGCSWWGPIIETFFPGDLPKIKELGFFNVRLTLDNKSLDFNDDDTSKWKEPAAPWKTLYHPDNGTWIVGSP